MGSKAIKMKDKNGNKIYPCPYYPVGSIYISINDTNPKVFFGGTWEKINSKFLIASGTAQGEAGEIYNFAVGGTGGEYSHKLTVNEMPKHGHYSGDTSDGFLAHATGGSNWKGGFTKTTSGEMFWYRQPNDIGGNGYHNNLPPFLVVNMWKRTA